jgi:hypothetical protein
MKQYCLINLAGRDPWAFKRLDATAAETALFASKAMLKGRIVGWSPAASFIEERNMQGDLGFLQETHEEGAIPEQTPVASASPLETIQEIPSENTSNVTVVPATLRAPRIFGSKQSPQMHSF